MARIAGVDLPKNKRGEIGLTYIYGIGRSSARKILTDCGIDFDTKVSDWNDDQIAAIRSTIAEHYKIEGELRSSVQMNIKRLMDIDATEESVTVSDSPYADRAPRTTPVHVRVRRRRWPTRKKQLSNK